jgi:two-component system cell cycle response regulator
MTRIAKPRELETLYNDPAIFRARIEEEIRRARRYPTFLSLIYVDVSHVKSTDEIENFSEVEKFHAGLSNLIKKTVRETDLISSNGGGKIAVLLLDTPRDGASAFSKRLKRTVRYFLANNTVSPVNWRVPMGESCFPGSRGDDKGLLDLLDSMSN